MNEHARQALDDSSFVELRIPAEAEWAAVARLTVAEACTHAIQRSSGNQPIELIFEARPDAIVVTVRDSSTASHLESVEEEGDENHIGGLGLFIIRSLMDEVDFRVDTRRGGELTMLKRVLT